MAFLHGMAEHVLGVAYMKNVLCKLNPLNTCLHHGEYSTSPEEGIFIVLCMSFVQSVYKIKRLLPNNQNFKVTKTLKSPYLRTAKSEICSFVIWATTYFNPLIKSTPLPISLRLHLFTPSACHCYRHLIILHHLHNSFPQSVTMC